MIGHNNKQNKEIYRTLNVCGSFCVSYSMGRAAHDFIIDQLIQRKLQSHRRNLNTFRVFPNPLLHPIISFYSLTQFLKKQPLRLTEKYPSFNNKI